MPAATLSFVLQRIRSRYGRMTRKVAAQLTEDLNNHVDIISRRWKFWFNTVEPGIKFLGNFPFANQTALSNVVPVFGNWVDQGWLLLKAGQKSYPFAQAAYYDPTSSTTTPGDPALTPSGWAFGEIVRVNHAKVYGLTGVQCKDLNVANANDFLSRAQFTQQATPLEVFHEGYPGGVSSLVFSPIPDQNYIVSIGAQVLPVPLDRPDSVNGLTAAYPDVAIKIGQMIAAEYFNEKQERMIHESDLYGPAYAQAKDASMSPGGLIGQMIADTKMRSVPKDQVLALYRSSRRATGRSTRSGGYSGSGGGYFNGFGYYD